MKTYAITLSKHFLTTHKRAGEDTDFKEKFLNGEKIHTIRANYPLWEKRIKEVQEGNAVLSNDGLSFEDWEDWFRGYDLSKPLAIIHFTKFRY